MSRMFVNRADLVPEAKLPASERARTDYVEVIAARVGATRRERLEAAVPEIAAAVSGANSSIVTLAEGQDAIVKLLRGALAALVRTLPDIPGKSTGGKDREKRCCICKAIFTDKSRTNRRRACYKPACRSALQRLARIDYKRQRRLFAQPARGASDRTKACEGCGEEFEDLSAKNSMRFCAFCQKKELEANPHVAKARHGDRARLQLIKDLVESSQGGAG